jgi:integrase
MFCFAAHTGARRSEILRAEVRDVDFDGMTVEVRERKRVRGKRSARRVPLTGHLAAVLKDYLRGHPGGPYLFYNAGAVARRKTRSPTTGHKGDKTRASTAAGRAATVGARAPSPPGPITKSEATDHFKRTLRGSKWEVVKGWHVLRHSFISNCVARRVDQRYIDRWCGHTTNIRDRYIHLIPSDEQQAIRSVFG